MKIGGILKRLQGVQRNRSGWIARCPAHEDHNPSLSVGERDGKILLHCHAGCTVEAICAALGIEMRELFANDGSTPPWIVAKYPYHDERGKVLFEVARFEPKSFRQRRPDGNGGWIWNLKGVRRVLYRLPEVIAAEFVLVVEGEKDVESARSLGLVATCNSGGAGKWQTEYSEVLHGKRVAIVVDADEPGRKHAGQVAQSLHNKAESVKVFELPAAKDFSEWVEKGGTREKLEELIRSAAKWRNLPSDAAASGLIRRVLITETSNAERLIARYREEIRFCSDRNVWCAWDGDVWVVNDIGGVTRRMQEITRGIYLEAANETGESLRKAFGAWAKQSESRRTQENSVAIARYNEDIEIHRFSDLFDTHPLLLNVNNGTIDLQTGELHPHRREDFLTKMVPIEYDPKAECPKFSRFLNDTLPAEGLVGYLTRFAGYCLTGLTSEQSWFMFYGGTATGKSTLINVLRGLLGPYALALPENYFLITRSSSDFATATLAGVRLATCVETNEGKRLDVAKIKSLTGEDEISAALKYENFFQFRPQAKLVLATNNRPHVPDTDESIWRRVKVVPFDVTVPEEKRIPELANKFLQDEGPGILRLAVLGCQAWRESRLGEPEAVKSAVNEYRTDEDTVQNFLDECCTRETSAQVARRELFAEYTRWNKENGLRQLTTTKFAKELHRLGIVGDNGKRFWLGVHIKGDFAVEP